MLLDNKADSHRFTNLEAGFYKWTRQETADFHFLLTHSHTLTDHVIGHVDLDLSLRLKGHLTLDALVGFLLQDQRPQQTALMCVLLKLLLPWACLTLGAGKASDFFPAAVPSAPTSG